MEAGMRPIDHSLHTIMFHRIPVDVIYVLGEVVFVAEHMFPKAALPNPTLFSLYTTRRDSFAFFNRAGEMAFDQVPACRVIAIARR